MSKRTEMLASVIREAINPVLLECMPLFGVVSITEVDVSDDVSFATVYISALEEPEKALQYLQKKQRSLQKSLVRLERNKIPKLRFRIDERTERGQRIDQILKDNIS